MLRCLLRVLSLISPRSWRPACPTFEPEVIWLLVCASRRVFDGLGSGVTVTHFCCRWRLFLRTSPHGAPQLLPLTPPPFEISVTWFAFILVLGSFIVAPSGNEDGAEMQKTGWDAVVQECAEEYRCTLMSHALGPRFVIRWSYRSNDSPPVGARAALVHASSLRKNWLQCSAIVTSHLTSAELRRKPAPFGPAELSGHSPKPGSCQRDKV